MRFAIGLVEGGAVDAGGPESEVLIEMEKESEEARPLKRMQDPKEPNAEERRSHALTPAVLREANSLRERQMDSSGPPPLSRRGTWSSRARFGLLLPWLRGSCRNRDTCRTGARHADDLRRPGAREGHEDSIAKEKGCWLFCASSGTCSVPSS